MNIETKCLHAGYEAKNEQPCALPIVQSTTYKFDSCEHLAGLLDKPTTTQPNLSKSVSSIRGAAAVAAGRCPQARLKVRMCSQPLKKCATGLHAGVFRYL